MSTFKFKLLRAVFFLLIVTLALKKTSGTTVVEILAQINKPFAVVSALQSVWFIYT